MALTDVHSCLKLSDENEKLRRRFARLKRERDQLSKELQTIKEKQRIEELLKNYATTRDSSAQTDPPRHAFSAGRVATSLRREEKKPDAAERDKTNKVLSMHSQLLQRYDREVKKNMAQQETIAELQLQVAELERKVRDAEAKVRELEKSAEAKKSSRSRGESETLQDVVRERNRLKKENKKLKDELKGLDKGFFEEIEDIKYAFQQSAKLNKEYEKTLRKLCQRFGVPYPCPEQVLGAA